MAKLLGGTRIYGTATIDTVLFVNSSTASTSTNSGALQVVGGIGVGGNSVVGGSLTACGLINGASCMVLSSTFAANQGLTVSSSGEIGRINGSLYLTGGGFGSSCLGVSMPGAAFVNSASACIYGGSGGGVHLIGGPGSGDVYVTKSTVTTSTTSGALQVAGGLGVVGGGVFGGTVTATNFVGAFSGTITGTATTATNLAGGTTGSIPYQVGSGQTDFIGIGAANTLLLSNGTTATWVSTTTLFAGVSVSPATPTSLGTVFGYTTGLGNTAIGCCAGNMTMTGCNNFAAGCNSLVSNTAGGDNIGIGTSTLYSNTTGNLNLAIGGRALYANTTGIQNIALGYGALYCSTASNNIAIGILAMCGGILGPVAGTGNIAIGTSAAKTLCSANGSVSIGFLAQCTITSGNYNIGVGYAAASLVQYGLRNVAIGAFAGRCNISGSSNTAVGYGAGYGNLGACNTHIGSHSGGFTSVSNGSMNVGIGVYANRCLCGNTSNNAALGAFALRNNTTGQYNTAVGICAGVGATGAAVSYNTFVGNCSGFAATSANCNVAVGYLALSNATSSIQNTVVGYQSGCAITTGSYNVVIGSNTGSTIATSSCNIIISDGLGNARICATNTGSVLIPSTNLAVNTQTGALQVAGGVGVGGDTYIGGGLYVGSPSSPANALVIDNNGIYRNGSLIRISGGGGVGTSPSISGPSGLIAGNNGPLV